MGCNCGKKKTIPAQQQGTPQTRQIDDPVVPASPPRALGLPRRTTGKTQSFSLIVGGRAVASGSKLEVEAARVRAGNTGTIVPS